LLEALHSVEKRLKDGQGRVFENSAPQLTTFWTTSAT
jgi:hypothetical protein